MKKVVVGFVSAAALATITVGMAAGTDSMAASNQFSSNPANVYIDGNLGYGKFDAKNTGLPAKDLRGFTWGADLGYQFNQYAAIEAGYTQFHELKGVANGTSGNATLKGVDLMAKGIMPINDQFNVFAKAGAMDLFLKTNPSGRPSVKYSRVAPAFGLGTAYNVTQNVALTLQGITTLAMKGPHAGTFTMPATYAAYAGLSYKFNV